MLMNRYIIININVKISDKAKVLFRNGMTYDPDNKKCREALKKA